MVGVMMIVLLMPGLGLEVIDPVQGALREARCRVMKRLEEERPNFRVQCVPKAPFENPL